MAIVFEKPKALTDAVFHYCPGCPHGIIHSLVAEITDELGITGKAIGETLNALLEKVMEEELPNEKQALLAFLQR